ncbi:MAG: helicase-associated domain-containing protein [Planctomycetota bacterium]|nr:helicase-associated domain-containing protein [Planctomycetota bacterium]
MTERSPEPNSSGVSSRTVRIQKGTAAGLAARRSSRGDLAVSAALKRLKKAQLREPFEFWAGGDSTESPAKVAELRGALEGWMCEPQRAVERKLSMGEAHQAVVEALLLAPRHRVARKTVLSILGGASEMEVLGKLERIAMVFREEIDSEEYFALPGELADALLLQEIAEKARGNSVAITLKGYLDERYAGPEVARPMSPSRLREMFKMYAKEPASVARVERLPEGLRDLVGKTVLEFGGLLPRRFFERMETELPHWNQRRWAKILEESLVGTTARLELERYGIQHEDDTLIVFNEVTLAWFKRVAVPSDPDAPHDEAALGVDLMANISRFLAYIIDHAVRFTVKGEIFKTTEKRILTELIPNPGRELERGEVLQFIFRFSRSAGLIEVTGERTFKLTAAGRDWESQDLDTKLAGLFEYVTFELDEAHESVHHPAMRRILSTLMKRLEVGVWYDVMYLPFLARNAYLSQLDTLEVDEMIAARGAAGAGASEDLQRLAWNLVGWVRKRLYLLGLVDLGYDSKGHPVAMRLTRSGARVLGIDTPEEETFGIGRLVVTPDFEVVLFSDGDDAVLTHDLDRFTERTKDGALRQFRINEKSVHRGLVEGMTLSKMREVLTLNARTPVPRNVLQSIRDWAAKSGLLLLGADHVLRAQDEGILGRFARDAGVRPFIKGKVNGNALQLKSKASLARYRTLFRDLGYLIELEE